MNSLCLFAGPITLNACSVGSMLDIVFITVSVLFFVVSIGYVAACDRLMK